MPKYLCLQRSFPNLAREMPSANEMQEIYAKFNAWREQFQSNLVDMGGRLGSGQLITGNAEADGPFVEVKELIGGYMVVSAENLQAATDIARLCPGLVAPGSGVEVIEILTA